MTNDNGTDVEEVQIAYKTRHRRAIIIFFPSIVLRQNLKSVYRDSRQMEGCAFFKSLSRRWCHAGLPRGPQKGRFLNLTIRKTKRF